MRIRIGLIGAVAAVALAAPAASQAATPTVGPYHGVVYNTTVSPCKGNEGEGWFRLRSNRTIGPLNRARGEGACAGFFVDVPKIMAPSNFQCHQFNVVLNATSIPLTATNTFRDVETVPIGPGNAPRRVVFRGAWKTDTLVAGSTRVSGGGCDATVRWRMHTY